MTETTTNSPSTLPRRIARALLWPLTRFFDPRFRGLAAQLDASHDDLAARLAKSLEHADARTDAIERQLRESTAELERLAQLDMEMSSDATTLVGEAIAGVARTSEEMLEVLGRIRPPDDALKAHLADVVDGTAPLNQPLADFLNHADSHRGFAATANLWFNPPVSLSYANRHIEVTDVNERIVEIPYVLRALGRVDAGARVLDVGASESLISLFLASLGYHVTALDPRGYPLSHPLLEPIAAQVQEWEPGTVFDAVVCLSTIEHIGLGAYGESQGSEREDLRAMDRIRKLTAPGGMLVLTTPYGTPRQDSFTRIYDKSGLDELLAGWQIDDLTIATREGQTTWIAGEVSSSPPEAVALVSATRRDT